MAHQPCTAAGAPTAYEQAEARVRFAQAEDQRAANAGENPHDPVQHVDVRLKRSYEPAASADGYRVLIDRLWPRGVSRERARLDDWARELAPSDELRKWFDHVPERFGEFRSRYRGELAVHGERIEELRRRASVGPLTVLYAARDQQHNNAVVLVEVLGDA